MPSNYTQEKEQVNDKSNYKCAFEECRNIHKRDYISYFKAVI